MEIRVLCLKIARFNIAT